MVRAESLELPAISACPPKFLHCGRVRVRTPDLLGVNEPLYQLSYAPESYVQKFKRVNKRDALLYPPNFLN